MTSETGLQRPTNDTRDRILSAAEELFVERGIAGTPTRAILQAAGQRNESALQYHFGGREGLIQELYERRGMQVARERQLMLEEFDETVSSSQDRGATIRRLCEVAFLPAVRVARRDPTFVQFLKLLGQLAFLPGDSLKQAQFRYEGETVLAVETRLRPLLTVPAPILTERSELVSRMVVVALTQRARADESFDGPQAALFFSNLVDVMASALQADTSAQTDQLLQDDRENSKGHS